VHPIISLYGRVAEGCWSGKKAVAEQDSLILLLNNLLHISFYQLHMLIFCLLWYPVLCLHISTNFRRKPLGLNVNIVIRNLLQNFTYGQSFFWVNNSAMYSQKKSRRRLCLVIGEACIAVPHDQHSFIHSSDTDNILLVDRNCVTVIQIFWIQSLTRFYFSCT
jgi:hypothetical protein